MFKQLNQYIFLLLLALFAISNLFKAHASEFENDHYYGAYKKATVTHVKECFVDNGLNVCIVVIKRNNTESPAVLNNMVKVCDKVYKECKMKMGNPLCSQDWKTWLSEDSLTGGEITL